MNTNNTNASNNPKSGTTGINAKFVFHAVRQWWLIATPVGLVLATLAAAALYVQHVPQFKATATLLIRQPEQILFRNGSNARQYVSDQVELIRSELVIDQVVGQLPEIKGIQNSSDRVRQVRDNLDVHPIGQSSYYQVSYSCPDPATCKAVVDELTKAFFDLREDHEGSRTTTLIELLETELQKRQGEVTQKKLRIQETSERLVGKDLPFVSSRGAMPFEGSSVRLAELDRQLAMVDSELMFLRAQLTERQMWEANNPAPNTEEALAQAVESHPQVVEVLNRISAAEAFLDQYELAGHDGKVQDFVGYRNAQSDIEDNRRLLEQLRAELSDELKESIDQDMARARADQIAQIERRIQVGVLTKGILEEQQEARLDELKKSASPDYWSLEFERIALGRSEEVVKLVSDRLMQLNVERSAPSSVEVLRPAIVPVEPIELIPLKKMILGSGVALVLPFLMAVLWEFRVRRVNDTVQLQDVTHLPVIGEVALLPMRRASERNEHGLMIFEESIDSLRTGLVLSESLREMRVLAVTSATSQEGKTSVASQLAVSIARATGDRTLLIDGDMRSPDMHNVFDLGEGPGLAEVLAGKLSLEEAVVESWNPNLDIMPAGNLKTSPHKLVGQQRVEALLSASRDRYRYVIIDTPPLLAASEALVMAKAADASLVCAMRNYSRVDQVQSAYRRLGQANASPVGVVLNGVPTKKYAQAYGKYAYSTD